MIVDLRSARRQAGERIVEVWRRDIDGAVLHCKEEPHFVMPEQWKLIYIIVAKLRTGL